MLRKLLIVALVVCSMKHVTLLEQPPQNDPNSNILIDCHPDGNANEENCNARGCDWVPGINDGRPWCIFPSGYGYEVVSQSDTENGFQVDLQRKSNQTSLFGNDANAVRLSVECWNENVLRLKFYDPSKQKYEVPLRLEKRSNANTMLKSANYKVEVIESPQFGINVIRTATGTSIFNTNVTGFTFSDQFLQITTLLPSPYVYGYGEQRQQRYLHDLNWKSWTMFGRDHPPSDDFNLYGVQPFHINVEEDGNANGVFLFNSNAMEVVLQPAPAITFRSIGGILDFYIYFGPTPEEVAQQHHNLIGLPQIPSYWFLGYQLCRFGYTSTDDIRKVIDRMLVANVPYDVQMTDIDTLDSTRDFTVNPNNFADMAELVQEIHNNGQKYIPIVDAAIGSDPSLIGNYTPLDDGLALGIFVKYENGTILNGQVWPGLTHFPDFSHDNAQEYWTKQHRHYYDDLQIKFDGIWIDMNEPSNFVSGSVNGCNANNYNYPPYTAHILGSYDGKITEQTICMDTVQQIGLHYDVHNLYAYFMAMRTYNTLREILVTKRGNVLSRSQYAGSGKYANHWLGDNYSTWSSLRDSIPDRITRVRGGAHTLKPAFFKIKVGADICGFQLNTTLEICIRWTQLGAFYPYCRNHNIIDAIPQDPPALGTEMVNAAIRVLYERYRLLPYLYTLLHEANTKGGTVARPLVHEFPQDTNVRSVEFQYLWGAALYISPVVYEGSTTVDIYFPITKWYDYYTGKEVTDTGSVITVDAPLDGDIPLHLRGGYILPTQQPSVTTTKSRQNPYGLTVAPDENGNANGNLFWDDGETYGTFESGNYNQLNFVLNKSTDGHTLYINVVNDGFNNMTAPLDTIKIYGISNNPTTVTLDEELLDVNLYSYDSDNKVLHFTDLGLKLPASHSINFN